MLEGTAKAKGLLNSAGGLGIGELSSRKGLRMIRHIDIRNCEVQKVVTEERVSLHEVPGGEFLRIRWLRF